MSIVISNIQPSAHHDSPSVYEVCINDGPAIARFEHVASDGLVECLRKAVAAVDGAAGGLSHLTVKLEYQPPVIPPDAWCYFTVVGV